MLEKQGKNNYLHRRVWLKWLQFLLKHSHHLQPALVGILREQNMQEHKEDSYIAHIWLVI